MWRIPRPRTIHTQLPHAYTAIATLLAELEATVGLPPLAIVESHVHEWFNTTDFHDTPHQSIPIYRPGPSGAILEIDDDTWQLQYDPY